MRDSLSLSTAGPEGAVPSWLEGGRLFPKGLWEKLVTLALSNGHIKTLLVFLVPPPCSG
jgi:hypothetical protein